MDMGFVEVPGGKLFFETAGSGPPVVFIHPGLWDCRTWDDQFGVFAESHTAIRYDVRGYGKSSFPTEPYSDVEDLAAVMDRVGAHRAALVGCSMGGNVAISFALEHPDRVSALVPVASGCSGFEAPEGRWEGVWAPIGEALQAGELERATDLLLEIWAPLGTSDPAGRRIREIALDNTQQFRLDEEDLAIQLDPSPFARLEEISAPTLVILGSDDVEDIADIGEALATRIPGARKVVIERADHVVNMRQLSEFNRVVLDFLASD